MKCLMPGCDEPPWAEEGARYCSSHAKEREGLFKAMGILGDPPAQCIKPGCEKDHRVRGEMYCAQHVETELGGRS